MAIPWVKSMGISQFVNSPLHPRPPLFSCMSCLVIHISLSLDYVKVLLDDLGIKMAVIFTLYK